MASHSLLATPFLTTDKPMSSKEWEGGDIISAPTLTNLKGQKTFTNLPQATSLYIQNSEIFMYLQLKNCLQYLH